MSQNSEPFSPSSAGTVSRTVSGSSASVALAFIGTAPINPVTILVQSLAANAVAFIEFGSSTVTASLTTGMPIQPGATLIVTPPATATHVAAIGTAGTLYLTTGHGK